MNRWDIRKVLTVLVLTGFLTGIIYGNLIAKEYILSTGIFDQYYLDQYSKVSINANEYIWYIFRMRITPILFLLFAGCTKYKKIVSGIFIIWTGFSFGMIITTAVLKLKIQGVVLCMVSILPHFICYIAGYLMLLIYYMSYPNSRWSAAKTISLILFWLLGIITECYINPVMIDLFIRKM